MHPKTERVIQDERATIRPNPVALEVPVSVTGTQAGSEGARQLFTEETQTVLVFRDGAVIRLTAPVTARQLLFLTNKKSNAEVVCQVLGKRTFGSSTGYVELQFTEEKEDYWGVSFPSGQKSGAESGAVQHVEAAKAPTGTEPAIAPHSAEDVDQLKSEVEALRQQLLELQKKRAGMRPNPVSEGVPWMTVGSSAFARGKEELRPVSEASPESPKIAEPPLLPTAGGMKSAARAVVSMALPMGKSEERGAQEDPSEKLLPKPELDFSKMPGGEAANASFPTASLRPPRTVHLRKVAAPLLAVMGAVLALGAWYGRVWTYLPLGNQSTVTSVLAGTGKPAAALPMASGSKAGAGGAMEAVPGPTGSAAVKVANPSNPGPTTAAEEDGNAVGPAGNRADGSAAAEAKENVMRAEEGAPKRTAAVKGRNTGSSGKAAVAGTSAELVGADAPMLAARLLKAANPVYPPDAMRSFITGDVKAEAMVEADGHVGEVKVLSGPKPLREAAVEALKRYRYAPATQGGKAVASKVTETVKFWFNP